MRGYLIPRFETLVGSTWESVLLVAVLFGLLHIHKGFGAAAMSCVSGIIWGTAFCATRRILARGDFPRVVGLFRGNTHERPAPCVVRLGAMLDACVGMWGEKAFGAAEDVAAKHAHASVGHGTQLPTPKRLRQNDLAEDAGEMGLGAIEVVARARKLLLQPPALP